MSMNNDVLNGKYCCPICGDTTFPLLPVGSEFPVLQELDVIGSGHRFQRCHRCKGSDRDRLVFLYLKHYTNLIDSDENYNFLHVAPEDCLARIFLNKKNLNYLPIDSFEHGYKYPNYLIQMDLLNLNISDNSMDYVMCNHVLQDITDDVKAMQEIYRVLKPEGTAILQVPISNKIAKTVEHIGEISYRESEILYGHRFHKRIYAQGDYLTRLESVGFKTNVISVTDNIILNSINPREKIFAVTKQK